MHWQNQAERAIRTFKDHFLAILAGVDPAYPPYLRDLLLPQTELTLNLLRQAKLNPKISAWEYFNGPFDFNKTLLGPVGCQVLIHAKPSMRRSWDYCANTASLELIKLLLNSVISRQGARFSTIDINNFYLDMPILDIVYVLIKLPDIPEEFVTEYNLSGQDRD